MAEHQLFEAARNTDQTEGRGHMQGFNWFDDLAEAVAAVQREGVQGIGPGDVNVLYLLTDIEKIRANGGPVRRVKIYGRWWDRKAGRRDGYAPGWDPRGDDPEWLEYLRLREKFEK